MKRTVLLVLQLPWLFTACASVPEPAPIKIPTSAFRCAERPPVPPEDMTDAELAVFITRLDSAGEDCRAQLAELRDLLELQGVVVTDVLVETKKPRKRWGLF